MTHLFHCYFGHLNLEFTNILLLSWHIVYRVHICANPYHKMKQINIIFLLSSYGSIYPSTGANLEFLPKRCMLIGLLGSMEAFVGVLYAGFCTAVLFGKVIRSQSRAQIYFSDPMVVRFGKGELCDDNEKGIDVELGEGLGGIREERGEEHLPCPSLEFRLVNRLHDDVQGGEIGESEISCFAAE